LHLVADFNDWRTRSNEDAFAEHAFERLTDRRRGSVRSPRFLPLLTLDKAFHRALS